MGSYLCKKAPEGEQCIKKIKHMRNPILLVLGRPKSGKTKYISLLCKRYHFIEVNPIKILRDNVAQSTELGRLIESIVFDDLSLIPRRIIFLAITEFICERIYECSGFLFHGFPRDLQQAVDFEEEYAPISMVLCFDLDESIAIKKIAGSHLDEDGMPTMETLTISENLKSYEYRNEPLINYFKDKVVHVDATLPLFKTKVFLMDTIDELFVKLGLHVPNRHE